MTKAGPSILDQLRAHRAGVVVAPESVAKAAPIVGSYERISDAYESAETGVTTDGVERQADANGHIARARGWEIGQHYVDNNVSAYKVKVRRDAFEQMLDDLGTGVIGGVVAYNLDRLARQVSDLERLIAIYDDARQNGAPLVFATAQGDLDLSSDDGLTMARVMVAFANKASRDTARRVAAKHQATRDRGRVVSGARAFGWGADDDGNRVLNDAEANAIRWAASALTEGTATWRDVVRKWNALGLCTPNGNAWQPVTVKQSMRSPRLAGWLVHKGKIAVHSVTGKLVRSQAPAILTDDEYEALLTATTGKAGEYVQASNRKRYLLAGIVRCSECGGRMVGNAHREGRFYYKCADMACRKVSASGLGLDEHVTALVLPRIVRESKRLVVREVWGRSAEVVELEEERADLLAQYEAESLSSDVVFPRVHKIDEKLEQLRKARSAHMLAQRQIGGRVITKAVWETLSTDEKRAHIARHVEAVYVTPVLTNTGRRFDATRVQEPVWKVA